MPRDVIRGRGARRRRVLVEQPPAPVRLPARIESREGNMGGSHDRDPGKENEKIAKSAFVMAGIVLFMFSSLAVLAGWLLEPAPSRLEYMSTEEVCQRWGRHPLDIEKFKAAGRNNRAARAEMACALLDNQSEYMGKGKNEYLGKSPTQIVDIFGKPDGYHITDTDPAYLINHADRTDRNVWQIVFLIRKGKVHKIVVHKNCCYQDVPE